MKYKSKPIHKIEVRETVEKKFLARGGLVFHACLLLVGTMLFLVNLPGAWTSLTTEYWDNGLADSAFMYGLLTLSFALNFCRYHFRYGAGYEKFQAQTAASAMRHLRRCDPDEWQEQEELIRLQQQDKLKNLRLLWQHLALFMSIGFIMFVTQLSHVAREDFSDWGAIQVGLNVMGIWGIGVLAHGLRYVLAYGRSPEKRQAKIDAEVAREMAGMRAARRVQSSSPARSADEHAWRDAQRFADVERTASQEQAVL